MPQFLRGRAAKAIGVGIAAVGLFFGGVAWAGNGSPTKTFIGGGLIQTKVVTAIGSWSTTSQMTWQNVHGATLQINVPGGATRLVTARFNAETMCSTLGIEAWCATRVMAHKTGASGSVQLHPRSGVNFAIDSPGGEAWEGNSMTRSIKLGSGTWTIWVQGMSFGTDGSLDLDDWHYELDVYMAS
jgi:hypothetical protein